MSTAALRLVVNRDSQPSLELPTGEGSTIHLHLHLDGSERRERASLPPDILEVGAPSAGRTERKILRRVLLSVGALALALVSYDLGARTADEHDQAVNAMRPSAFRPPALRTLPDMPAMPGGMPSAVRERLATSPTVETPTAAPDAGAPDPFGLHR